MMQVYPDNVNSSMKALKTVLAGALRDKFKSGTDKKHNGDVIEEIVNVLCGELEEFFVKSSNVQIDQVSGRIEAKLNELGLKDYTFSDELLSALSENAKGTGLSDAINALASVNIDKKISELQTLFETHDDNEALDQSESDSASEEQVVAAGDEDEDNDVKKKKKKKKTTIEKVAQYLDDTFKDVLFFENIISRIDYTIRTALSPVYNFNEQLIQQQQALAQENMKLANEYVKLAGSTIDLAVSSEALAMSNMTLASSRLALAASTFMLAVSTLADAAAILVDAVMNVILAAVNVVFAIVYFAILSAFAVTVVLVTAAIIAVLAIATIAIVAVLVVATAIIIVAIVALTAIFLLAVAVTAVMLVVFTAVLVAALVVVAVIAAVAIIAAAVIAAAIVIAAAVVMAAAIAVLAVILAAAIMAFAVAIAAIGYGVMISMQVIASTAVGVMVSMMAASVSFVGSMALGFVAYTSTLFLTTIAYGAAGIAAAIGTVAALVSTVSLTILLIALLLAFALNKLLQNVHEAFAKWWEESPLRQLLDKVKEWWEHSSLRQWIHDKIEAIKSQKPDESTKKGLWDTIRDFLANNEYVKRIRDLLQSMKSADSIWDFLSGQFPFVEWIRNGLQYLYDEYMPGPVKSVLEWWKKTKQTVSEALDWVAEKWGKFTDWCVDIGNSIIDGLSSAYDAVVGWASGIIKSAKDMLQKAWDYCTAAVNAIWSKLMAYIKNIGAKAGSYAMSGLNRAGKFFAKISYLNPFESKEEYEKSQAEWDRANQQRQRDRAELDAELKRTLDEINAKWKADQDIISAWSNEADRQKKQEEENVRLKKEAQKKNMEDTKSNLDKMLSEYKKGNAPAAAGAGSMTGAAIGSSVE